MIIRLLLMLSVLLVSLGRSNADWPAFLGGQARDAVKEVSPPLTWSPETGVTWQMSLPGYGQSSPIVIEDRVYVTAVKGPMKESNVVVCLGVKDGQEFWQQSFPSSLQVKNNVYTSRAAPTPVADQSGVFAFFESGNLLALSPQGEMRWERDLVRDFGKYQGRFGLGGSLAQTDDAIYVLADNEGPAYLAAFSKQTGETLWKTDRESRTAWSSPIIMRIGEEDQVVVSASGSIDGYDINSGQRLWSYEEVGGNTVASPIALPEGKFLVGASPGRDGENTEGAKQSNLLMQVVKKDSGYEPKVLWRNSQATSSFGSPIMHRGRAYFSNRAGVAFCIDGQTGETIYTTRLSESNWATPVGIGDHVFFFGKDGVTTVLKSGAEKKRAS